MKSNIQLNVIKQLAIAGALLVEEYKEKNIYTTLSNGSYNNINYYYNINPLLKSIFFACIVSIIIILL